MNINIKRVEERITGLAKIGRTPEGGVSRLSYTPCYKEGMELIKKYMTEAGMKVRIDGLGNVIGRYEGSDTSLPVVLTGSHLDTVPNGGAFDGALGVITAIECVNAWYDSGYIPTRPVEVIAMIEEEGTLFGCGLLASRVLSGKLKEGTPAELFNQDGRSLKEMLSEWQLDLDVFKNGCFNKEDIHCFIELHAEQGAELYNQNISCGIVTDIVGIYRLWLDIIGSENHSGTTKMVNRKDALAAASHLIHNVYEQAFNSKEKFVATVGDVKISPGALNIVPGKVTMPIEIRAPKEIDLENAKFYVHKLIEEAKNKYNVNVETIKEFYLNPAHMDDKLVDMLIATAISSNTKYLKMPSWAGHDAQMMADFTPTSMIFVPSIKGISHSPQESTKFSDIEKVLNIYEKLLKQVTN